MKARTKLHHRIVQLSRGLPKISLSQEQWAKQECLPHIAFANKSSAFCLDCGNSFSLELISRKRVTCPHCHTKLIVEQSRKTTFEFENYFAITHVVEEFQVVESFQLIAYYKKGKPRKIFLQAILEDWIMSNGNVQKIGLKHWMGWNTDSWSGDWEIREIPRNYYSSSKYDVYPRMYHPDSVFKAEYRQLGINKDLSGLSIIEAIKLLPNTPKAETLLKAKQYALLGNCISHYYRINQYWDSIKICLRNKYKVQEASTWFDYLDMLTYFNKDLRNAKYVCPKDLKKEHDRLMIKKQEKQKREADERRRREIAKAEAAYSKKIKPFSGLSFSNGLIVIKALESVKEFETEGDILKHCVFANEYYNKEESLVLSARINGVPIETIEVNLDKMKIEQSRGLKNNPSEYNKTIVSLVKRNLNKIKELAYQQQQIS